MASPDNQGESEVPSVVGRRSVRLSIIIPIVVRGTDNAGRPFKENASTIAVNKHGAKLAIFHHLGMGAQVTLENPVLGRSAKARVVYLYEKKFAEDPFEIGVELLEPQNVWGVKFPPEDWQVSASRVTGPRVPQYTPEGTPPAPATTVGVPSERIAPQGAAVAPALPSTERGKPPGKPDQFRPTGAERSRFAERAEEGTDVPGAEATAPAAQVDTQLVRNFMEAVSRLEEREKAVRALEQELSAMEQATKGMASSFSEELTELSRGWREHAQAVCQHATRSIEEGGQEIRQRIEAAMAGAGVEKQKLFEQALEHAADELSRIVETAAAGFRNRIEQTAEAARIGTEALLARLQESRESSWAEVDQRQRQMEQASSQPLQPQMEELGKRLRQELEAASSSVVEDTRKRVEEVASAALEASRREATARLAALTKENLSAWAAELQTQQTQAVEHVRDQMNQVAETAAAGFRERTEQRAAARVSSFSQELEAASSGAVESARKRVDEVASAAVEVSSRELTARLAALTEEKLPKWVPDLQAQQTQAVEHSRDQITQIVETTAAGFREHMERAAAAMASSFSEKLAKLTQESGERAQLLSQNAARFIEGSGREIRQRTEAAMAGAAAEKQKLFEQAVSQRLAAALGSLSHALGEAKAGWETGFETIEGKFKVSLERCAADLQKLCGAALEEFRRTADAARESLASEQELALRQFREGKAPALLHDLEQSAGDLLESSASLLQRHAQETLELLREQLGDAATALEQETKQRVASMGDAAERQLAGATAALLDSLKKEARAAVEEVEKRCAAQVQSTFTTLAWEAQARELSAGQLTAKAESVVDGAKEQLAAATAEFLESLKKEARAAVEECRAELPRMILELRDRGGQDLEVYLQGELGRQRETWLAQLRKEIEDSGQRAVNELRNQFTQVASEASDTMHKQVGRGAIVLKDWADQVSARMGSAFQQSLNAFQKQISEASAVALERHRQESDRLLDSAQNLLNEAARFLQPKRGE